MNDFDSTFIERFMKVPHPPDFAKAAHHERGRFESAKRLLRAAIRKLHRDVPVYYLSPAYGNLELTQESYGRGKNQRGNDVEIKFIAKNVMDILHQLKRDIDAL